MRRDKRFFDAPGDEPRREDQAAGDKKQAEEGVIGEGERGDIEKDGAPEGEHGK